MSRDMKPNLGSPTSGRPYSAGPDSGGPNGDALRGDDPKGDDLAGSLQEGRTGADLTGLGLEDALDALLAEARARPPQPSDALMTRVLAEALALQPQPRPEMRAGLRPESRPESRPEPRRAGTPRRRLFATLAEAFGGRGVLAGLGAVAVLGLYLGYADPAGLTDRLVFLSDPGLEMTPAAELFLTGG